MIGAGFGFRKVLDDDDDDGGGDSDCDGDNGDNDNLLYFHVSYGERFFTVSLAYYILNYLVSNVTDLKRVLLKMLNVNCC